MNKHEEERVDVLLDELDELEQLDELEAKELKEGMAFHLFRFR